MSIEFEKINNKLYSDISHERFVNRIKVLRSFLDDNTIIFILENNVDFLNKISISSLLRGATFYSSLEDFNYASIIKWYPIMLDFDRFNIIISYFKEHNISNDEIVKLIEKSIRKDFELADLIKETKFKNINTIENIDQVELNDFTKRYETYTDYIKSVKDLEFLNTHSKENNETFENLLNNNINKYSELLRRLR